MTTNPVGFKRRGPKFEIGQRVRTDLSGHQYKMDRCCEEWHSLDNLPGQIASRVAEDDHFFIAEHAEVYGVRLDNGGCGCFRTGLALFEAWELEAEDASDNANDSFQGTDVNRQEEPSDPIDADYVGEDYVGSESK
jgi:hypothetical protein